MRAVQENLENILEIKKAIAEEDILYGFQLWKELDNETKQDLWVAPTYGGIFTTKEREIIKSTASSIETGDTVIECGRIHCANQRGV